MIFSILKKELKSKISLSLFSILNGISILFFAYFLSRIIDAILYAKEPMASDFFMLSVLLILKNFTAYKLNTITINLTENVSKFLREKLHFTFLSSKKIVKNPDTLLIENINAITDATQKILPIFLNLCFHIPLFLLITLFLDFKSFLIMIATIPIVPILLYLIGNIIKKKNETKWHELIKLQEKFKEILNTTVTIKIFCAENIHSERIRKLSSDFSKASIEVLKIAFISSFAVELASTLSIAITAVTLGFRLIAGNVSFNLAFFILLILPNFYQPLRESGMAFHSFINAKTAWEKLLPYFNLKNDKNTNRKTEKIIHPPALTIKDLSFSYNKNNTPTLSDISFKLSNNSFTLLLGESGSGKSTLLNLIANYENDYSGEILIEDYPTKNIAPENFSKHIAYAPQTPHIFEGSFMDNLTLFRNVEKDKIINAIKLSMLEDFYKKLPDGLDTFLGKNGIMPSAGEIRRIGLGRVILLNSPLILLDEITAGLDEKTEEILINNLEEFAKRKTVLFATHRDAVIRRFKNHILLDGGKIVEGN